MEGRVYSCRWSRAGRRFRIALSGEPAISVTAPTFDQAEEDFCILLGQRFGDGEPTLEYDRAPPRSNLHRRFSRPDLVSVSGVRRFVVSRPTELFQSTLCQTCGTAVGVRTDKQLRCDKIFGLSGGAVSAFYDLGGYIRIFSEEFVDLLTRRERAMLELRPVGRAGGRKRYLELAGRPIAQTVGVRRFPGLIRRKCPICGHRCFSYLYGTDLFKFVAAEDLPDPVPSVFVVQDENQWMHLCMTRERFSELRAFDAARGVSSYQFFVASRGDVIRDNDDEDYPEELMSPRCGRPIRVDSSERCAWIGCNGDVVEGRKICAEHLSVPTTSWRQSEQR